jgi:hypothetical protein
MFAQADFKWRAPYSDDPILVRLSIYMHLNLCRGCYTIIPHDLSETVVQINLLPNNTGAVFVHAFRRVRNVPARGL